jgi:hypothetical protein
VRILDISDRKRPAMLIVDAGEPHPSGPMEVTATASIERCCPRCTVATSISTRPVRVKTEGQWMGTTVHDAETGAKVCEAWSVIVTMPDDGQATAEVKAHHANDSGPVLCSTCCPGQPRK